MEVVNLFSFETRADAAEALADLISGRIAAVLENGARASLALSGGSSPEPCYKRVAAAPLDFSRIDITLVDDRWVDAGSSGSNQQMIERAFEAADGITILPLKNDAPNAVAGAAQGESAIAALRPFDIIVLGMGPDAHTASWFPTSKDLSAATDPNATKTLMGIDASGAAVAQPYKERITLTLPPVAEAGWIGVLMFGSDKRDVLMRALEQDIAIAPIRAIFDAAPHKIAVFWAP